MSNARELGLDLNRTRFWRLPFNKLAWFGGRDFIHYERVLKNMKSEVNINFEIQTTDKKIFCQNERINAFF